MFLLSIDTAKGGAGTGEQRLGGVNIATEVACHFGYREPVEVPQGKRGPLVAVEMSEGSIQSGSVESGFPRVVDLVGEGTGEREAAFLPTLSPPVVDELVACYTDQPRDGDLRSCALSGRGDRGHERLGG
jgi:hypothetical protein